MDISPEITGDVHAKDMSHEKIPAYEGCSLPSWLLVDPEVSCVHAHATTAERREHSRRTHAHDDTGGDSMGTSGH